MKIYTSNHSIVEEDRIKPGDVPLACIVNDSKDRHFDIEIHVENDGFTKKESVMPYESFDDVRPFLFNDELERVDVSQEMIRNENSYAFFPKEAKEFYPEKFDYRALIKRREKYRSDRMYNITIGCIHENEEFINGLVRIFGNAYERGMAPPNVRINSGDISKNSFLNKSIEECDFVFIESIDGVHIGSTDTPIVHDDYLVHQTNLVIITEAMENYDVDGMTGIIEPVFTLGAAYQTGSAIEIYGESLFENEQKEEHVFMGAFESNSNSNHTHVLTFHREKEGYVQYMRREFFDKTEESTYRKIFYNTILEYYGKSYYKSEWQNRWITDDKVDYLSKEDKIFGKTHERASFFDLISTEGLTKEEQMNQELIDIEINNPNVILIGVTPSFELLFKKAGGTKDPVKRINEKSYYTTRESVIYYDIKSIYKIETPVEISISSAVTGSVLTLGRLKSTSMKIDTPIEYNIRIPDVYGNFVVSVANNVAIISPEQVYSEKDHGIKIATVRSTFHSVIRNYDARTFGGGLPDDQKDNYNLLDISHINGRPYRKGGDVVITLPKAVESHHEIVDKAVSKHISSGDRHIIIYE